MASPIVEDAWRRIAVASGFSNEEYLSDVQHSAGPIIGALFGNKAALPWQVYVSESQKPGNLLFSVIMEESLSREQKAAFADAVRRAGGTFYEDSPARGMTNDIVLPVDVFKKLMETHFHIPANQPAPSLRPDHRPSPASAQPLVVH